MKLFECSRCSVSKTSKVSRSVVRLVSQTTVFDKAIEYGKKAQIHPAHNATPTPKTRRAIKNTGTHGKEENRLFTAKIARADEAEQIPKTWKTPATKYWYTAGTRAGSPVDTENAEVNPF